MPTPIRMPALGQTSDELRLIAWLKSEGETVREGEPLLEIETDKATLEVEASVSGTLLRTVLGAGETVLAGTVAGWIGEPGEAIPEGEAPTRPPAAAPEPAAPRQSPSGQRVLATPAVRTLARELGIDLSLVAGSGPGGRIERRDVEPGSSTEPLGEQPVPKNRQVIARRLARAASVPQFSVARTVDIRAALELAEQTEGLTLTHLLLKAVAVALGRFPAVNRLWVDEGPRFRQLERNNVGLAIASDDNLIVATIPDPDGLSLEELALTVQRAVAAGREGRLTSEFTEPAAVTVSNLGVFGVDRFEAIVDPDQTAILAVGRVVERPAVTHAGIMGVRQLDLTLTVDHRTVNGAEGARFLVAICEQLER